VRRGRTSKKEPQAVLPSKQTAWGPGRHSQRKTKNTHPAKSETRDASALHDVLELTLRLAPNLNSAGS
jgi:hypothetical protein